MGFADSNYIEIDDHVIRLGGQTFSIANLTRARRFDPGPTRSEEREVSNYDEAQGNMESGLQRVIGVLAVVVLTVGVYCLWQAKTLWASVGYCILWLLVLRGSFAVYSWIERVWRESLGPRPRPTERYGFVFETNSGSGFTIISEECDPIEKIASRIERGMSSVGSSNELPPPYVEYRKPRRIDKRGGQEHHFHRVCAESRC